MIKFLLSDKAVWLLFLANYLAAIGWFMVKSNGGTESEFPLFRLSGLGLGSVLFFWGRAVLRAKALA
jgi:purine-cytosine permease-like protein